MQSPHSFDEALSHCDAASVLDSLAVGIAMLDSHLCLTYANSLALELLAIVPQDARGRPFASLFQDSSRLAHSLRAAMECGDQRSLRSLNLLSQARAGAHPACLFDLDITPVDGFATGPHLLLQLELADDTGRQLSRLRRAGHD